MRALALILIAFAAPAPAQDIWQDQRAAYFGVTLVDTSLEGELGGPRADEAARVTLIADRLAEALEAHGLILADLAPVRTELDRTANPADCYGCALRMAEALGARYAVVAEVQKVSNLILSMNVVIRETGSGRPVRALAVDVRSNTDESWLHGMNYILRHGIFPEG